MVSLASLVTFLILLGFAFVLLVATYYWGKFVDKRRQDIDPAFLQIRGFALEHHIFEFPAFFVVGYAIGTFVSSLSSVYVWGIIVIISAIVVGASLYNWFLRITKEKIPFGLRDRKKRNAIAFVITIVLFFLGTLLGLIPAL